MRGDRARRAGAAAVLVTACVAVLLGGCGNAPATPPAPSPTTAPTPTLPTSTPAPTPPTPAATIPAALRDTDLTRLPTSRPVVALTFDAGANADSVAPILRTLQEQGVPATFFLTGRWVGNYPDQSRAIGARYDVGNHSRTHPHLTALPDAEVRAEITTAEAAIRAATGVEPRPLFRFPFGDADARTIGVVNRAGYVAIRWSVDTLGWKGTSGGQSVRTVVDRVLGDAAAGQVVLMHVGSNPDDGSTLDADALPQIITSLRGRGYSFVTVGEVLAGAS